jgi:hypothetical protein
MQFMRGRRRRKEENRFIGKRQLRNAEEKNYQIQKKKLPKGSSRAKALIRCQNSCI